MVTSNARQPHAVHPRRERTEEPEIAQAATNAEQPQPEEELAAHAAANDHTGPSEIDLLRAELKRVMTRIALLDEREAELLQKPTATMQEEVAVKPPQATPTSIGTSDHEAQRMRAVSMLAGFEKAYKRQLALNPNSGKLEQINRQIQAQVDILESLKNTAPVQAATPTTHDALKEELAKWRSRLTLWQASPNRKDGQRIRIEGEIRRCQRHLLLAALPPQTQQEQIDALNEAIAAAQAEYHQLDEERAAIAEYIIEKTLDKKAMELKRPEAECWIEKRVPNPIYQAKKREAHDALGTLHLLQRDLRNLLHPIGQRTANTPKAPSEAKRDRNKLARLTAAVDAAEALKETAKAQVAKATSTGSLYLEIYKRIEADAIAEYEALAALKETEESRAKNRQTAREKAAQARNERRTSERERTLARRDGITMPLPAPRDALTRLRAERDGLEMRKKELSTFLLEAEYEAATLRELHGLPPLTVQLKPKAMMEAVTPPASNEPPSPEKLAVIAPLPDSSAQATAQKQAAEPASPAPAAVATNKPAPKAPTRKKSTAPKPEVLKGGMEILATAAQTISKNDPAAIALAEAKAAADAAVAAKQDNAYQLVKVVIAMEEAMRAPQQAEAAEAPLPKTARPRTKIKAGETTLVQPQKARTTRSTQSGGSGVASDTSNVGRARGRANSSAPDYDEAEAAWQERELERSRSSFSRD